MNKILFSAVALLISLAIYSKSAYAKSISHTASNIEVKNISYSKDERSSLTQQQQTLLELINNARNEQGLQPVQFSDTLSIAAQTHVRDIVVHNYSLTHTGSDGSSVGDRTQSAGYPFRFVGENVAAGYSSASETFEQWMNSEGHRKNILDPDYSEIGIGYYINAPRTSYDHYWVLVLGHRD